MSILSARNDTVSTLIIVRNAFWGSFAGGVGLALLVLLLPKDFGWPLARLLLACCFFSGVAAAIWALGDPLANFLRAKLDLSLEDGGDEMRTLGYQYVETLELLLKGFVWPALGVLLLVFLRILAEWPIGTPLLPFVGLLHWSAWLAVFSIPVILVWNSSRIMEVQLLWSSYQNQLRLSGFRAVSIQEGLDRASRLLGPPVIVNGPYNFQVGGIDWTWQDIQKNAIIFGETGSGKTVTVLNAFLDGLLSSANGDNGSQRAAALILDPKGDYRDKITHLCRRLSRNDELLILDPNDPTHSVHYNPFDCEDDALEISDRFAGLLQLMGMKNTQDTYWIDNAKLFIRHSIGLLRATEPKGVPPSFTKISELMEKPDALMARLFICYAKALLVFVDADTTAEAVISLGRSESQLKATLDRAPQTTRETMPWLAFFRRWLDKSSAEKRKIYDEVLALAPLLEDSPPVSLSPGSETQLALDFMLNSWQEMPEKTRGSVQSQLKTMIDPFLGEPYRTIFSGRSTVRLGDILDQGRIFYVYMPLADRAAMSRTVNTLIKLEFYRQVLLRRGKTRPSLFFCDEFQGFFSSDEGRGDAPFFERSRESFHGNVVATQNFSGLLRDVAKEDTVRNFLGNCAIKIFLRNTEGKTNEFASKDVFGEYMAQVVTSGRSVSGRGGREGVGVGTNIGTTLQRLPRVPPERFTKLSTPDRGSGVDFSEAMIHLGSRSTVEMHRLRFKVHPLSE
ncbi:MAG: type IV secretory system conjugative DNA transfer family protein [Methylobacter sp.]